MKDNMISQKEALIELGKRIKKYWYMLAGSMVFAVVYVVLSLYIPKLIGYGTDKIIDAKKVDFPGLKNVIKYVVMITMIQAMKLFTQPYVMTQGGPQNSTRTLVYYIYEQGFQSRNFGYACSVATVFFVIVVTMSLMLKRVIKAD